VSAGGRTRITTRALTRLIAAVSAEALVVMPDQVSVVVTDAAGKLAIHVRSPIRINPMTVRHTGATVLERAARAQDHIRLTTARLSGADVTHVTVQVSGAIVSPEGRRVR
jgi:hypothetical protein